MEIKEFCELFGKNEKTIERKKYTIKIIDKKIYILLSKDDTVKLLNDLSSKNNIHQNINQPQNNNTSTNTPSISYENNIYELENKYLKKDIQRLEEDKKEYLVREKMLFKMIEEKDKLISLINSNNNNNTENLKEIVSDNRKTVNAVINRLEETNETKSKNPKRYLKYANGNQ